MKTRTGTRTISWQAFAILATVTLVAIAPLLLDGPSCGHDFDFHLVSWMEALRSWHAGILYPHWAASPNYGAGEARFVFYPPLTWMLGAFLGAFLPWQIVPTVFTALVLLCAGLSMYCLARNWLPEPTAILAASLYLVQPYTLFNAYERTAYGELAGSIWLPLILLFALRRKGGLAFLSVSVAGIWLTNAPSAVIAGYLLAAVAVLTSLSQRSWLPILRAVSGQLLGMGLAAFYILPGAYEQRWVSIAEAIGPGMRVEDSWLFGHTGEAFHDQVLHTASAIAVTLLLAATLCALGLGRRLWKQEELRLWLLPGALLLPVLAFLHFPASALLWNYLPKLKFLQFPWRLQLAVGLLAAMLAASACDRTLPLRLKKPAIPVLFLFVFFLSWKTLPLYQSCDEEDAVSGQILSFQDGKGIEGTDEYAPLGADNTAVQKNLPDARFYRSAQEGQAPENSINTPWVSAADSTSAIASFAPGSTSEKKYLRLTAPTAGFAVLKLREYQAWKIEVNGKRVERRPQRPDGLLTLPIAAGENEIEIRWSATPDVILSRVLSLLSLAGLLATSAVAGRNTKSL